MEGVDPVAELETAVEGGLEPLTLLFVLVNGLLERIRSCWELPSYVMAVCMDISSLTSSCLAFG